MTNELIKTLDSIIVKEGYFIRECGSGFCLSERVDGIVNDIAYKGTLSKLVADLKSWNCGIIL